MLKRLLTGSVFCLTIGLFLYVQLTAQGTGSITGIVTNASTSARVANVSVYFYTSTGTLVGSTSTDGVGTYSSSALPAGSYFVQVDPPISSSLVGQLYTSIPCLGGTCTITDGTLVTVTASNVTPNINFALQAGGPITGTVTNAATSARVPNVSVYFYTNAGSFVGSVATDAQGQYTSPALLSGSYFVQADPPGESGLLGLLYNNLPCPSGTCVITDGTPVTVSAPNVRSNINFALPSGGTIHGDVTNATTSAAVPNVNVLFYTSGGTLVGSTITGALGEYTSPPLTNGSYVVQADPAIGSGLVGQLYNGVPCPGGTCDTTGATPVVVTAPNQRADIDFALQPGGTITGTVRNAATTVPVSDAGVFFYSSSGAATGSTSTDAQGRYESPALPSGTYFVQVEPPAGSGLVGQLYASIPCLTGTCTVTGGTPVAVTAPTTTPNVNFSLPVGGTITGTVNNGSSAAVSDVSVYFYNSTGVLIGATSTDAQGQYVSPLLPPASYFVLADPPAGSGLVGRLYNNLPCLSGSCTITAGTAVTVAASTATPNINFTLQAGGTITGTVTNASATPVPDASVFFYTSAGALIGSTSTDAQGLYTSPGLSTGSYKVLVDPPAGTGLLGLLYNNTPCPGGACTITAGTSVSVTAPNATPNINFALSTGGTITGTVTNASSTPVSGANVFFYTSAGTLVGSSATNAQGLYTSPALSSASYFVQVDVPSSSGLVGQLYQNLPCPSGSCVITAGTLVTVTAPNARPNINFTLQPVGTSTLTATPTALRAAAVKAPASTTLSSVTGAQTITVAFSGVAGAWTASTTQTWLSISGGAGTGAGIFTVSIVNPSNVIGSNTSLSGTVTVTSTGATGSPLSIPVTLTVSAPGATAPPFGVIDTPLEGSTGLQGSFAVTGWALDDIAIDHVELWRDPIAGETTPPFVGSGPGNGKIFIARPTFISGSRPDVQALYPGYPLADRAGWGYLLLSWGLWNQGNGTYKFYAFAFDVDGQNSLLGTKTVTVNNAAANKPFGALDAPAYDATVAGNFWNYGWALTPNATPPCTITNGNVMVSIDSGALTPVNYGDLRSDIAASFPGFTNATNAGGAFFINTTALTNGRHQIGWLVTDSCGRADGIGSRFFNVLNTGTDAAAQAARDAVASAPSTEALAVRPASAEPVAVRQMGGDWQTVGRNADGTRVVELNQDGRIEVQLPAGTYTAYQEIGETRRAMPLGSSLDSAAGVFYWQPAAGFLGKYDLVFASPSGGAAVRTRVVVGPPMRAAIDTPQADAAVTQPFTLAGWALDLAANENTGVDTVHVWAYPATGADPIFVGISPYGGSRPDVGSMFGKTFANAAYDLTVDMLPTGTYDLVVYPHRSKTNTFEGAQIVRVTVK